MGSHTPTHGQDPASVVPIDPLHDIDGHKTFVWVTLFVVVVFGSMWLLAAAFSYFIEQEQRVKVYDRETIELNALRATETAELGKAEDLGGGKRRIPIEEALRRLAEK